jgi:hypothetical protein
VSRVGTDRDGQERLQEEMDDCGCRPVEGVGRVTGLVCSLPGLRASLKLGSLVISRRTSRSQKVAGLEKSGKLVITLGGDASRVVAGT